MTASSNRPPLPDPPGKAAPPPEPVRCIVGDTIREVRVLTEEEWDRIDPADRPSPAEHLPGLGWVVASSSRRPA